MLCTEQLTAKLCPVFYSVRLAHKTNTCFPFFPADYENFRHVLSMKNDDLPLSNMANTETNVCYKILRAGYCLLVVTQENVFSRCTMTKEYFSLSHLPNFSVWISRAVNPLSREIFQHAFCHGGVDFFWNNPMYMTYSTRRALCIVKPNCLLIDTCTKRTWRLKFSSSLAYGQGSWQLNKSSKTFHFQNEATK